MSSGDQQNVAAGALIERLLVDPEFRAEFRRDPAAACAAAGLPGLAAEFTRSAKSMDTLMVRESRSSLAGVVMAVAVEGMSVGEAQALIHHGLAGAQRGRLPHVGAWHGPLGHVHGAASPAALEHKLLGPRGGSLTHHLSREAHSAGSAHVASSGSTGSESPASSGPAGSEAPAPSGSSSGAPSPATPPTAERSSGGPAAPQSAPGAPAAPGSASAAPAPPDPGAQPARGGVIPTWPDERSAGGGAGSNGGLRGDGGAGGSAGGVVDAAGMGGSGAPTALLDSSQLSAPADVRAFLTGGGADPRLVSVLNSALANHSIGLGQITSLTDPVHVQAVSIVSVDGQPVGPNNFGARDLVTEIAALDPSLRPTEIGTPWPIHAQGFFSDPGQQAQLRLAFVSQADSQPAVDAVAAGSPSAAVPPASPPAAVAPGSPADALPPAPATDPVASAPTADAVAPAAPADAVARVSGAGAGNAPGHYVNMLPADVRIGRTDMGVDANLNPGEPIAAPGTSRVLGITPNWYRGQPYVALQLLDGPMKGHNYYIAEQITPAVSVGQVLQPGQPIGHYATSGTGIEMGWASSDWERTLAQATSGYSEGEVTPAGASFRNFLSSLGHGGPPQPEAPEVGPDPDDMPNAPPAQAALVAQASPDPDDMPAAPGGQAAPSAGAAPVQGAAPVAVATPLAETTPTPESGAMAFKPAGAGHGRVPRPTVQFLPAVQPSPDSPLYGQAPPVAAPQAVGAPEPTEQATAPQPGAGGLVGQGQQPAEAGLLDQGAAVPAAMAGGSISVSSSLLTSGQEKFAGRLAELTGLDPRVVAAWELAEESGGAAQGREAASNFNWLNIGYFDSGAGKIAFDKEFGDPISGAEQTAKFLKGEWGGASSSIRAILNSVGHSPAEQMAAIANSDWASSHYGGGANLRGTYNELGDIRIENTGTP